MNITVAIVEDQLEIRESLRLLINGSFNLECVGAFSTAEDAIAELPNLNPKVVLVDIHLPGSNGIQCVGVLKQKMPNTNFVMCTSLEDSDTIFDALKAGASGYLSKTSSPVKILEAISEVHLGGSPMSASIARKVVSSFQLQTNKIKDYELTKREEEILDLLSKGFRYKELADQLFVSLDTIRSHVRHIYEKLQVNSRTDAINKVYGSR